MSSEVLDVSVDADGSTYMGHPVWVVHLKDGGMCTVGKPHGVKTAAWLELIDDYEGKLTHGEWVKMINQISIL